MKNKYRRLKLAVTENCNLNCIHCYFGDKERKYLPIVEIQKRIHEAKEIGVEVLDITGAEPTTHPNFLKILEFVGNKQFTLINLSTNGLNLSKNKIFRKLKEFKIKCNISIDGSTSDVVDKIRGKNVFSRLEHVFRKLKSNNILFSFRFSINNSNYREINNILQYSQMWGVDVDIEPTQFVGKAATDNFILTKDQFNYVKDNIEQISNTLSINVDDSFRNSIPCDGGFSDLLSINVDGVAVTCLMIDRKENKSGITSSSLPLKTQWDEIQEQKKIMREFHPNLEKCHLCANYSICSSGCLVTAYYNGCLNGYK